MNHLDFIYKRHSVRKFKDQDVPVEDIKKIIKAATYAPSGKNVQNWHFVVVKNKEKIEGIAKTIERKNAELANLIQDEDIKKGFTKFLRFSTVFRKAPVLILVYTEDSYKPTGLNVLKEINASTDEIHELLRSNPAMQNIGAAMENLILAATNMGYGTCWMTSQNYAAKEITEFIGFEKEGYFLAAMTPLGIPDGEIKSPPRKSVEEVMTIIE
ncbi:nitroreductase family protein [Crassaminicella thermophila]|uniref:Nitroreductase family protein n=1 Tax=Crassaminicella thermophila TaxID=2599308 RepID=A0A5C0SDX1_CRATE|nr:nitroreductase family protein [Crassaminicella thermophila]QEK12765.1 nitroreductase family protein [Crassaminicella thermophila]